MKIAIMSRWNATCGISLHAELLGRKLVEMGHEVIVYAPTLESASRDWHHKQVRSEDEAWVHRIFDETEECLYPFGGRIKEDEILREDYEVFVVESYVRFPVYEFKRISGRIRRKAPLIQINHLGCFGDATPFMEIDWDAIIVFDKRYIEEIFAHYGREVLSKVFEIPYPYAIIEKISPFRPKFAEGKFLFFSFGRQPVREYFNYIHALRRLRSRYDIAYWIVRSDGPLPHKERWLIQTFERPDARRLYSYLMGSDVHLLPKWNSWMVVTSSTLAQTLYSGTPTVVPDTRHFEMLEVDEMGIGVVVKYRLGDPWDLYRKMVMLIEDEDLRRRISRDAKKHALNNSDEVVAKKFLELVRRLGS
ncbi:MAG: glycosyl transferase family 1 [Candidatus Hecatellales archaeon]|nr:MAG: glycosyl transferase family 1 [Candidatus Hecatellales archaeon]